MPDHDRGYAWALWIGRDHIVALPQMPPYRALCGWQLLIRASHLQESPSVDWPPCAACQQELAVREARSA
jgi:hypothetical protein